MNIKVIVSAFIAGVVCAGSSSHAHAQSAGTTNDAGARIPAGRPTVIIVKKSQRAAAFGHRAQVGHTLPFQPATCSKGRVNAAQNGCVEPGAIFEPARAARVSTANDATAIGANAHASGDNSTALGAGAQVVRILVPGRAASCSSGALTPNKRGCVDKKAIFTPARSATTVAVQDGTAIGAGAVVGHNGSVALGAGARTSRANQVVLGTRDQSLTAPGLNSQASRDAQSGRIGIVTSDGNGNLANSEALADTIIRNEAGVSANRAGIASNQAGIVSNQAGISSNRAAITSNQSDIGSNRADIAVNRAGIAANRASNDRIFQELEKHARGIAIATAMPDANLTQSENFMIAGNVGGYGGETALGFSGAMRIDQHLSLNVGVATDTGFKDTGWKVGGRVGW